MNIYVNLILARRYTIDRKCPYLHWPTWNRTLP